MEDPLGSLAFYCSQSEDVDFTGIPAGTPPPVLEYREDRGSDLNGLTARLFESDEEDGGEIQEGEDGEEEGEDQEDIEEEEEGM